VAETSFDIAVIGGGLAGLTAAHHAALAGASVAHFVEDGLPGGLVMNVGALDGWPAAGLMGGAELAAALLGQNETLGVTLVPSRIDSVAGGTVKTLSGPAGRWRAQQVIVATGAALRTLDVPGAIGLPAVASRNAPGAMAAFIATPRWWWREVATRRCPRRSISASSRAR
jgi:thioredoxin reductase (NADPH)